MTIFEYIVATQKPLDLIAIASIRLAAGAIRSLVYRPYGKSMSLSSQKYAPELAKIRCKPTIAATEIAASAFSSLRHDKKVR